MKHHPYPKNFSDRSAWNRQISTVAYLETPAGGGDAVEIPSVRAGQGVGQRDVLVVSHHVRQLEMCVRKRAGELRNKVRKPSRPAA